MSHAELVRRLEARDAEGIARLIDADPSLVHRPVPPRLLPPTLRGDDVEGDTALHVAALFGGREVLRLLLERGADAWAENAEGRRPVHIALEFNPPVVDDFEALGVEKDIVHAACRQDLDRMRELLDADPALASDRSSGLSVLGWATYYDAADAAGLLFGYGAGPDDCELRCAAGTANVDLGELLLDHGADVNETWPVDGTTALHVAAAHQYTRDAVPFVRMLLARGADPSIRAERRPVTALEFAREKLAEQEKAGIRPGDDRWVNYAGVVELLEDR